MFLHRCLNLCGLFHNKPDQKKPHLSVRISTPKSKSLKIKLKIKENFIRDLYLFHYSTQGRYKFQVLHG